MNTKKASPLDREFRTWCRQTERGGSVITGKSLREFFYWVQMRDHESITQLVEAAEEAKLQIKYLHDKFTETGTGNSVITRLEIALQPFKK